MKNEKIDITSMTVEDPDWKQKLIEGSIITCKLDPIEMELHEAFEDKSHKGDLIFYGKLLVDDLITSYKKGDLVYWTVDGLHSDLDHFYLTTH